MTDIGASLRESRMRAHIDISEVEAQTKIRAKYLRALENEEWNLLPGPVYVRSFLKTYGDYLGLDSRLLVDEFKSRYEGPVDHDSRVSAARARESERDRARRPVRLSASVVSPVGVIVVAVVVIVVALYVIGLHKSQSNGGASARIPSSTATSVVPPATGKRHTAPTHHRSRKTTPVTRPPTRTTSSPTTLATLSMVPTSTVWVCVEGPGGKTVATGDYTTGETIKASGSVLLVDLGNADETITVNGQAYTPPAGEDPIGLKVTPQGVTSLTHPPDCSGA